MPNAAQILAARRTALGLPQTVTGLADVEVRVTGEMCDYIDLAHDCRLQYRFDRTARRGSGIVTLSLLNQQYVVLRVEFNKHGRWISISTSPSGGYWNRTNTSGEHASALDFYRTDMRKTVYKTLVTQPNPPQWALDLHQADLAREDVRRRGQETANRARIESEARQNAINALIERHPDEYADLLDLYRVELALQQ